MNKKILLTLSLSAMALISCASGNANCSVDSTDSEPTNASKETLASWNTCDAYAALTSFVDGANAKGTKTYIPKEDRIAVFDMDGTLYGELFPTYLEYVMYEYRVLDDPTYKDKASQDEIDFANEIRAGVHNNSYPSGTDMRHANLAAKAYSGMSLKEFDDYAKAFLKKPIPTFNNLTYGTAFYQPMREVVDYLKGNDYQVYVVSGSDRYLCRALLEDGLGIEPNRVIGMDVRLKATGQGDTEGVNYQYTLEDDIYRTDELLLKNLKFNKVANIVQEIGKKPVLSFGNSGGDQAMHRYTLQDNVYPAEAFMLVADDLDRDYSYLSEEKITSLNTQWSEQDFHVVSMKNDFKTIYGNNVTKKA